MSKSVSPLALSLLVASALMGSAEAAPRTIVGMWKPVGQQCTPAAGAMSVQPLGVAWDEFSCDFGSVSRKGSTVTWQGVCMSPYDGERNRAVVVARERSGRLSVAVNGYDDGTVYQRCARGEY